MSRWTVLLCCTCLAVGCEPPARVVSDGFDTLPDPDVSRMLLFRESQLTELQLSPTSEELRAYLTARDRRGQGQALRERASVFDPDSRWLVARFVAETSVEQLTAHVNAYAALLPEPRTFTVDEVQAHTFAANGQVHLQLGHSFANATGQLVWEWRLFDPLLLPAEALASFVSLEERAVEPLLGDAFLSENFAGSGSFDLRLQAWASSRATAIDEDALRALAATERLRALLPAFAAETVNRWPALPSVNCLQTANLLLYPQLSRYPLFFFDPLFFQGDIGQTPWVAAMSEAGAGEQVDEVNETILWVHEQVGATGDTDLFDLGAPLQTGTLIVMGTSAFHGFLNLGHAVTVLGAVVEGEGDGLRVLDYLVIEKENPGLLPIRIERLSRVLTRLEGAGGAWAPGGGIRHFAYTPEGDPLPFAPVDPALLHPDA